MADILSPQMIRFELMSKIWGLRLEYESDSYGNRHRDGAGTVRGRCGKRICGVVSMRMVWMTS